MPQDIFSRFHRVRQALPPEVERQMPPPRSYEDLIRNAIAVAVLGGIGGLLIWQLSGIADRVEFGFEPSQQHSAQDTATAAQRVVFYEEDPNNPQGKRAVGSAIWRTEEVSSGTGAPPELAVRADIEIPERKLGVIWKLRRVTEDSKSTSHTIEVMFKLPPDFPSGGIFNVPGIWMKQAEDIQGAMLAGGSVKVTAGYFLIGLSAAPADEEHNIQLLKERPWFDIPIVYTNTRRAILAMEKGTPGERAFAQAFTAWEK